ncbi:cytosine permease [Burkholderia sp. Bp9142]|uniref:cytosine permease n=1 Tax=Burkholderia sp. Bp9142 TaxID=2184573 RepID=UPI002893324D|nr:cytosine permease [Burkholderia sp. Bp9142]
MLLLCVLVPWTATNLVDDFLACHGEYDVDSFFRQDGGIYQHFNAIAVKSYFIGIVAQAPFMATERYTGKPASRLGGADIPWIVGLSSTSLAHDEGCKPFSRPLQGVAASIDGMSC